MDIATYKKRLSTFFIIKTLSVLIATALLLVYVFAPIYSYGGEKFSFFDLLTPVLKTAGNPPFGTDVEQNYEGVLLSYIFIGVTVFFCFIVLLRLIVSIIRIIKSALNIKNERVHGAIINEIFAVNNGTLPTYRAKNYKKHRKINGSTLFFALLLFLAVIVLTFCNIYIDLLTETKIDLSVYGVTETYRAMLAAIDELVLISTLIGLIFSLICLFLSGITLIFKQRTAIPKKGLLPERPICLEEPNDFHPTQNALEQNPENTAPQNDLNKTPNDNPYTRG